MKVEAVNFRKSQEIWLLWLDCFITKFQNKRRGGANRSPPGPNRVKPFKNQFWGAHLGGPERMALKRLFLKYLLA